MHAYGTMNIGENGHLYIGGADTAELAAQYGTPLYVYDTSLIRERARGFQNVFKEEGMRYQVAYASKAFSCMAVMQLAEEEGLSLDVVSGGELHTALSAGFPPARIHFHGNNKSEEEIRFALKAEIGCFVVDNEDELYLLEEICRETGVSASVLLRVTPGIEAHTHDYILTGQEDSKFGLDVQNGQATRALQKAIQSEVLHVLGIHCHIGSQIFETAGFTMAIQTLFQLIKEWDSELDYFPKVLNLGGGFGIRYTEEDTPLAPETYVKAMIDEVKVQMKSFSGKTTPEIWIEPGRSLVGDAGTTLYKTGTQKDIPGIRRYVSIDGGMSDNIRPALYQAKYDAVLANRAAEKASQEVSIAGKCCESGDMLIWDIKLPEVRKDDLLAVFCTGAYGYSMASNYNRMMKPAVVFVENGDAQLVIRRETFEDLTAQDLPLRRHSMSR
ncbi:diaminopimelate decarboxylase [Fictibacillus aquaticus]|uniref:Diaminopimelate decarboxylase n=1 Tax=Fictibacillus aquaticus TaxID=2021314 RepID=A0A235FGC3_9BACL|nr:diaminopimelate decarboxylase [Fictibacillus aquaticus]OYD59775.1 diaminopimelate decarboxylase [Fictibacillus aquaticus]